MWFRRRLAVFVIVFGVVGCVSPTMPYKAPQITHLRVQAKVPEAYVVRVGEKFSEDVPPSGELILHIPMLHRGRMTYFLGMRVWHKPASEIPVVFFTRDGELKIKLSLADLEKLPRNEAKVAVLKLE